MPLVVPGINSSMGGDSKQSEWQDKLLGKKLGDASDTTTFAKKDLPSSHRVVPKDGAMTMDHNPDRMNIHVDDDGTVKKITHG